MRRGRAPIRRFGSACLRRPTLTLVVTGLLSVGLGLAMTRLLFDDDIRNMRSADNRAILLQNEVMEAFGGDVDVYLGIRKVFWGVTETAHLVDGIKEGGADAVLAASIFHFAEYSIGEAKRFMAGQGVEVRL